MIRTLYAQMLPHRISGISPGSLPSGTSHRARTPKGAGLMRGRRPSVYAPLSVREAGGGCYFFLSPSESEESTAMKASCGTSTLPTIFIRFLPSFCFSSSFRLREMSPP